MAAISQLAQRPVARRTSVPRLLGCDRQFETSSLFVGGIVMSLMLSQPVFQLRELGSARFNQGPGRKPAHPVVGNSHGLGYLSMLAHEALYRFSGLLNAFFYRHSVLTL